MAPATFRAVVSQTFVFCCSGVAPRHDARLDVRSQGAFLCLWAQAAVPAFHQAHGRNQCTHRYTVMGSQQCYLTQTAARAPDSRTWLSERHGLLSAACHIHAPKLQAAIARLHSHCSASNTRATPCD